MKLRDVRKAKVKNKRVILRVDYNIELGAGGRPRDVSRITATLPTITWLMNHDAKVILVAHRGRPQGRQPRLSLRPLVRPVSRLIKHPIQFIPEPLFHRSVASAIDQLKPGQVAMLENIRFEAGEEENSGRVARRLASLCDIVVNDAFADSHRAHASIVGLAKLRPAYAGLLLQAEVKHLSPLLKRPARPYVAILGGAKISTKLGLIKRLLKRADKVLLGGALANTILQAEGLAIGASFTEPQMLAPAGGLTTANKKLEIPCDVVVTTNRKTGVPRFVRAVGNINHREIIVDVGPDTIDLFSRVIRAARTIAWNGPMGIYEQRPFDRGTQAIAQAVAKSRARAIAGGGETLDAIRQTGRAQHFAFLSTGGGAMLEFLEGKKLPGLAVVQQR